MFCWSPGKWLTPPRHSHITRDTSQCQWVQVSAMLCAGYNGYGGDPVPVCTHDVTGAEAAWPLVSAVSAGRQLSCLQSLVSGDTWISWCHPDQFRCTEPWISLPSSPWSPSDRVTSVSQPFLFTVSDHLQDTTLSPPRKETIKYGSLNFFSSTPGYDNDGLTWVMRGQP